ncbi:1-acyl-sn-glycerol-3-phosphate acyltransferase alpha-like [Podarcis lilfordi]|uniref:1-acylglycerol-3-phosphate O-acyltransferase n=1 Tax=Podarcis lilfordi TaxID=74358 RepID=A0AA35JXA8_9SAUR|nr:1-acyl-sn-glycerol-3-phosphate acyltransferase alpha-like [Podarcis lilfordi]
MCVGPKIIPVASQLSKDLVPSPNLIITSPLSLGAVGKGGRNCTARLHFDSLPIVPAMLQILPERSTFIVKREILHFLTVGLACWLSGFIFVDRRNRETSANSISEAADAMVRDNLRICMFPEGTRDIDSAGLLSSRNEAFLLAVEAQVPVIPVVISSYRTFFNERIKKFTSGEVTIQILPPMKTEGLSAADVREFADRVRETMLPIFHEISALKQEGVTEEDADQAANRQVSS